MSNIESEIEAKAYGKCLRIFDTIAGRADTSPETQIALTTIRNTIATLLFGASLGAVPIAPTPTRTPTPKPPPKPPQPIVLSDRNRAIAEDFKAGHTYQQLATKYDIRIGTVGMILSQARKIDPTVPYIRKERSAA